MERKTGQYITISDVGEKCQAFIPEPLYEGQVVGEQYKEKDILVNVVKSKQLPNVRASGKDEAAKIKTVRKMCLEATMEYIQDDELVEICPDSIRIRKRLLKKPIDGVKNTKTVTIRNISISC